jgi:hypothetical protein
MKKTKIKELNVNHNEMFALNAQKNSDILSLISIADNSNHEIARNKVIIAEFNHLPIEERGNSKNNLAELNANIENLKTELINITINSERISESNEDLETKLTLKKANNNKLDELHRKYDQLNIESDKLANELLNAKTLSTEIEKECEILRKALAEKDLQ